MGPTNNNHDPLNTKKDLEGLFWGSMIIQIQYCLSKIWILQSKKYHHPLGDTHYDI